MAQYLIEHSCGHSRTANIYGTNIHGEREDKARRLATRPCASCRAQQEAAKRAREAAEAARSNAEAGFPPLTGTPEEIQEAELLRAEARETLSGMAGRRDGGSPGAEALAIYLRAAARETDAAAWTRCRVSPRQAIKARMTERDWADLRGIQARQDLERKEDR